MTYGCHNRAPFATHHMAQDSYIASRPDADTRLPRMVRVPHVMTSACQYTKTDLGKTDPGCTNCEHKK